MFAVAIVELGTPAGDEAEALAASVRLAVYDLRLRLAGPLPAIVLVTPRRDEALAVLRGLRQRGHGAVGCDLRNVVPGTAMIGIRHFVLEAAGLRADVDSSDVLPYARMQTLVHATHPEIHQVITHEQVYVGPREGTARRETITSQHDATQSLTLYRDDGATPWILREREGHYGALGPALGPVRHRNFLAVIAALRARAPHLHFDNRLALHPRSPQHFSRSFGQPDGGATAWADHGADLYAYLLALWFAGRPGGPYRS